MSDPIADFLTCMRNAQMAKQSVVSVPYSNTKENIAKVMLSHKFLEKIETEKVEGKTHKNLIVHLPKKRLSLKRVSRPGQRIYAAQNRLFPVLGGLGISIVSTSKGLLTGQEARKMNIGGEVICEVS